jgi:HEAT repeat protein
MGMSGRTLAEQTARRRDAAVAGHRGDVRTATGYLSDEDPVVRATALRALERAGGLTITLLEGTARDDEPSVRRAVAEVIGGRDDPELDALVIELLHDDEDGVVEMAAWAAGERERTAEPILTPLIDLATSHDDALVREAAVAALGAIGDERGLPAILSATEDKATVRRRAVLALAPFDGDDVDDALRRSLRDRDWQVRQAAEDLLA